MKNPMFLEKECIYRKELNRDWRSFPEVFYKNCVKACNFSEKETPAQVSSSEEKNTLHTR